VTLQSLFTENKEQWEKRFNEIKKEFATLKESEYAKVVAAVKAFIELKRDSIEFEKNATTFLKQNPNPLSREFVSLLKNEVNEFITRSLENKDLKDAKGANVMSGAIKATNELITQPSVKSIDSTFLHLQKFEDYALNKQPRLIKAYGVLKFVCIAVMILICDNVKSLNATGKKLKTHGENIYDNYFEKPDHLITRTTKSLLKINAQEKIFNRLTNEFRSLITPEAITSAGLLPVDSKRDNSNHRNKAI